MNPSESKVVNIMAWIVLIILALLPFHAFLSVWLSSVVGHYTLLRLWKEILLVVLGVGTLFILLRDQKLLKSLSSSLLVRLITLYIAINIVWGLAAYGLNKVTLKSLGFGLTVNLRFLIFFLIVWIIATKSPLLKMLWLKILLIPAGVVILAGLLQRVVLPYNFLKHFGYNSGTIFPYETINHNISYPRVMSTLRGANPLGAYLILVLTAIAALLIKIKARRLLWGIFVASCTLVLIFSYSRSAWIGAILSLLSLVLLSFKNGQIKRILLPTLAVLLAIGGIFAWIHHDNPTFENVFLHTQENSTVKTTSDWVGMILFIAINYLVACELWVRKDDILPRILLSSLIGITFVNLLSHAWTDDTLAYLWWGLAGLAIAPIITDRQKAHGKKSKAKS
jgi:hypothetical protein